ncbi:MAG: UDP pyrophosphate phosphatase [Bacilli bacterium]|nr:UDP pyrophosphate phosphatase [Bacilli bacterium]
MINILKYIFLGFVQGMTETIPVSSSGHLMIFKKIIDLKIDFDTIAILTNFGSLIAIIILFRKDLKKLIISFFKYLSTKDEKYKDGYKYCWLIVIGCIPAGIAGLLVSKFDVLDKIDNNVKIVGLSLIITASLLFMIRNFKGKKNDCEITFKDAIVIGMFQIIGLFPGISRSGSTIVGGMTRKLKRDTAFKYSFMLYIPMSIAAMALEITDLNISSDLIIHYVLAILTSLVVTFIVTKWFRRIVNEGKLIYFTIYCLIIGVLVLLLLK